jgi:quercetin dioxygenase-like cupin family protein
MSEPAGIVTTERVQVLSTATGEPVPLLAGAGEARAVVGPHMGARHRTMCVVVLEPGVATIQLNHPSEAVWYVVDGAGQALRPDAEPLPLEPGAMVHVAPGARYVLRAADHAPLRVVGGPSPPDPALHGAARGEPAGGMGEVRLFHRDRPSRRMPMISSDARLVVWPGVGAQTANMNYVRLAPGEQNVPHAHAESEDTIVILSGHGSVDDLSGGATLSFHAGDVIHVPAGVEHCVNADRGEWVESVGGPCPPDRGMLAALERERR